MDNQRKPVQKKVQNKNTKRPVAKKKSKPSIIPIILIIICIGAGSFALYTFYQEMKAYEEADEAYEEIAQNIVIKNDQISAKDDQNEFVEITYPDLDIDYAALKKINPDFVGVVYIPATGTCYPVAHSHDNDEYLNKTFDGKKSSSGCIFLDKHASGKFDEINSFLFGHNMKNRTMFGCFKRFLREEGLCDSDPFIYIYTPNKVLKYHIFFYGLVPAHDEVYNDFYPTDPKVDPKKNYNWYVSRQLERNSYKEYKDSCQRLGIENEFAKQPKLLTCSTCYGYGHKQFMICQAALMGEANTSVNTDFEFSY